MEKPVKLKILTKNDDGTVTALVDDGTNGGTGGSMPGKYRARISGINVYFDTEADLLKADQMLRDMNMNPGMDEEVPEIGRGRMMGRQSSGNGGGYRPGFLRTGADVATTMGAFLAGRGLRNKRDDLDRNMADFDDARAKLDALTNKYSDLVPILGTIFDRQRDEQVTSISILDDEILALDVAAGAGLADTVDDFWGADSGGGSMRSGGSNFGPALAVGGLGLGLGLYLSNRSNRGRRGR